MPLIVVNGVCRFTLHGTLAGEDVSNVVDMFIDTTGSSLDRNECIADQADVIWNEWVDRILPLQVDNLALQTVSWVDLDEVDGEIGSISGTGSNPSPQAGGDSGPPTPSNAAIYVRKTVTGARGSRAGSWYIPGVAESMTTDGAPNDLAAATVTSLQTAFNGLLTAINQNGPGFPGDYDSRLVVVHVTERDANGHPTEGEGRTVSALAVRQRLATQRRRMNGR